ncbi:MAG: hypothetical protein EOP45_20245 [Sphingobacteriaceae bacterium]|nr:MAG: hypothetical protein EOP45_20245 [Sphingobacteriaceae bacterium]
MSRFCYFTVTLQAKIPMYNVLFSQKIKELCPPVEIRTEETLTKRELRSEDRDKVAYRNINDVTYDLGGSFTNITSISIDPQGLEFPNTLDGITMKNNNAQWCFLSDPDEIFQCKVPRGNYVLDTILSALIDQMNIVMQPKNRVFTVQFVRETRSIRFTSYLNSVAPTNPLFLQANDSTVLITFPFHNLMVNDNFLLTVPVSSGDLGGLSASDLSGIFQVSRVIDENHFEIELGSDVPYNSGQLGGDNITIGRLDAFKFLNSPTSILPQIGFVAEDSATVFTKPSSDAIEKDNIYYIDNDRVLIRCQRLSDLEQLMTGPNTFRISSPMFGFSPVQISLINGVSLQYINLQGLTSIAITLPDIETNYYAKNVQRIWAKVQLSDQATSDLFNSQSSLQGTIKWPYRMDKLRIRIVSMQNEPVDFQGMNYSMTIYIKTKQIVGYSHHLYYDQ